MIVLHGMLGNTVKWIPERLAHYYSRDPYWVGWLVCGLYSNNNLSVHHYRSKLRIYDKNKPVKRY